MKIAFFAYAYNLAETTRGIEVAKALKKKGVNIQFFSHGGTHESRITEAGFSYTKLKPLMSEDHHKRFMDIDHGKIMNKELYTEEDWYQFAKSEVDALRKFKPDAVYAGFNIPTALSARVAKVPIIYLIPLQATPPFYKANLGVFPEFVENFIFLGM